MIGLLASILVFFSPNGGCEKAIISELAKAKTTVAVQAYYFTNPDITDALIAAKARHVDVQIILDGKTAFGLGGDGVDHNSPQASRLSLAKIPVLIDQKHAIAHNKIVIIDNKTVITGSYNFTRNAETNNAENIAVIHNKSVAAKYSANWNLHAAHSTP